jgi:hypothetical protein
MRCVSCGLPDAPIFWNLARTLPEGNEFGTSAVASRYRSRVTNNMRLRMVEQDCAMAEYKPSGCGQPDNEFRFSVNRADSWSDELNGRKRARVSPAHACPNRTQQNG